MQTSSPLETDPESQEANYGLPTIKRVGYVTLPAARSDGISTKVRLLDRDGFSWYALKLPKAFPSIADDECDRATVMASFGPFKLTRTGHPTSGTSAAQSVVVAAGARWSRSKCQDADDEKVNTFRMRPCLLVLPPDNATGETFRETAESALGWLLDRTKKRMATDNETRKSRWEKSAEKQGVVSYASDVGSFLLQDLHRDLPEGWEMQQLKTLEGIDSKIQEFGVGGITLSEMHGQAQDGEWDLAMLGEGEPQ